jgi:hypothetical protein
MHFADQLRQQRMISLHNKQYHTTRIHYQRRREGDGALLTATATKGGR